MAKIPKIILLILPTPNHKLRSRTLAFCCGARSASKLKGKKLLEKHAIAPSAARLCYASGMGVNQSIGPNLQLHQSTLPASSVPLDTERLHGNNRSSAKQTSTCRSSLS